jgi:hypothetical protein
MLRSGFGIMRPNEQRCFQDVLKEWDKHRSQPASGFVGERCPKTLPSPNQQRIECLDEPAGPRSRTMQSGCSCSGRVDKPGERARYSGSIKKRADSRGEERLRSRPHPDPKMILFASERHKAGSAQSAPVDTYSEIFGSTNAAYVAQLLHHHLKTRLG